MIGLGHGDVWWIDLDKIRPGVILTRRPITERMSRVLVAPITTTVRGMSTEVVLGEAEGLGLDCVANLDNVQLVPVERLLRRVGAVAPARWPEFCRAMAKVMAC